MWIGTATGLYAFVPQMKQQQFYHHNVQRPTTTIGSDEVTALRAWANGDLVIGLYNEGEILRKSNR